MVFKGPVGVCMKVLVISIPNEFQEIFLSAF